MKEREKIILILLAFAIFLLSGLSLVQYRIEQHNVQYEDAESVEVVAEEEAKIRAIEVKATAYCPCMKCCGKTDGFTATGTAATQGRTVAVDPRYIPYGTKIIIDGNVYIAEDCGGAIKGENRIDIFFDNHEEALEFGVQTKTAYILEE